MADLPSNICQVNTDQLVALGKGPTLQNEEAADASSQGVLLAVSPETLRNAHQMSEEAKLKREQRLKKNREAAREFRRKKKEYIKRLENRVAVLEIQNKVLLQEVKSLKDRYNQDEVTVGT